MKSFGLLLPRKSSPPKLADWQTLIIWSEIFVGSRVTPEAFVDQVRQIGKYRGLRLITAINSMALSHGETAPGVQIALAREFATQIVRDPILREVAEGHVLFAAETLLILAGYIIQHGAVEEPNPERALDAFIYSVLMVNELYGDEQLQIVKASEAGIESFLPMELRAAALDVEPIEQLLARLHAFIKWARVQPVDDTRFLNIDEAFPAMYGRSYEDVTAAGWLVRHYFKSINTVEVLKDLNPIMSIDFLTAPLTDAHPVRDFVRAHAVPLAELALELAPRNRMTASALLPLQRKPLVAVNDSEFACPSLSFFSASLGIGLFHRLSEHFAESNRRQRFYHFFARFLQQYAEDVVSRSVSKTSSCVVSEFTYLVGKKKIQSSDFILIEGRKAIFFEICNKRLNTESSLNAADLNAMHADIDAMILSQAKQLNGRIVDFRAGRYTINGLRTEDIDEIVPVAVTHQSIHSWVATRRYIDRRLSENGHLQTGPRLEIVSLTELEMLIQAFDGDFSYSNMFAKRRSDQSEIARSRSLKNFLLIDFGWDGKDKSENAGFVDWFANVAKPRWRQWGPIGAEPGVDRPRS